MLETKVWTVISLECNIYTTILTIRARKPYLHRLQNSLDREVDYVHTDTLGRGNWGGHWGNMLHTLRQPGVTHHLVLEDDAQPCRRLLECISHIVDLVPDRVISFFCTRRAAAEAKASGDTHWGVTRYPLHTQCTVFPIAVVEDLLSWIEQSWIDPEHINFDSRYTAYTMTHQHAAYYTFPSLINHDVDIESASGHGNVVFGRARVAQWFIGEEADPFDIDWLKGINEPLKDNQKASKKAYAKFLKPGSYQWT